MKKSCLTESRIAVHNQDAGLEEPQIENRRKHKRVTIKSIGKIAMTPGGRKFKAFIGGISRGGLEFYSEKPVRADSKIEITLFFLDHEGKEVSEVQKAKVRWSARFRESYIAGVQFSEVINEKLTPRLFEYIEKAEEHLS